MKRKREELCYNCWVVEKVVEKPNNRPNTAIPLASWKFNQLACRMALCEMIILDELPFGLVEREGFKNFVQSLCPQFKIPTRHKINVDCVKLFMERKTSVQSFFQTKGMGRVSITVNCWTTIKDTYYICVTAHCIDKDWNLHRKTISFHQVYNYEGKDELGASIISSLEEWGLKKVLCCTMGSKLANDEAIMYMKPAFERWNTSVVGGKYTHIPCAARIIDLLASDILEEIDSCVTRVREFVKWMKAAPDSFERIKVLAEMNWKNNRTETDLRSNFPKSLCLDVPTKWNLTYLMLESALPYAEGITLIATWDIELMNECINDLNQKKYKGQSIGLPKELDWAKVKNMIVYLRKFYDLTVLVSNPTYVTSHLFFKDMCDLFDLINELEANEDDEISKLAVKMKMKMKVRKYWLEDKELNPRMNKILCIAALLDPRQKMKHVEKCLKTVYGEDRGADLVGEVNNSLYELFDFYKKQMTPTLALAANTSISSHATEPSDLQGRQRRGSCWKFATYEEPDDDDERLEISIYFMEKQYRMTRAEVGHFDILQWWSNYSKYYPILSEMARDILAIPICSVPPEFAFSTESCVLSKFRSSLAPNVVEALVCAEDWLKSASANILLEDEKDLSEIKEKELEIALVAVGASVGGGPQGNTRTVESVQSQTSES